MRTVKDEARVLGIDDAPFTFDDDTTALIGTVFRGGSYLEAVLKQDVSVDGFDVTDRVLAMVRGRHEDQFQAVLLDGITYAGFNVADLDAIAEQVPVVAVSRTEPDRDRLESGLANVDRADERRELVVTAGEAKRHELAAGTVHFQHAGIDEERARDLLDLTVVRGLVPEPIRVAHLIGAALKDGESKGGA